MGPARRHSSRGPMRSVPPCGSRWVLRPELRTAYPPATEAVKKSLDQNITQVTEIRRLGRGQSIGSRCDKFQHAPASSFRGFVLESTVQLQLTAEARVTRIGRGIQS